MTDFSFKLDPETFREATRQAILNTLTPETREQLVAQAISNLLSPTSKDSLFGKKSPLEEAFDRAIMSNAFDVAKAYVVNNPEVMTKLNELVTAGIQKMLSIDPEKLSDDMARAFVTSLARDR